MCILEVDMSPSVLNRAMSTFVIMEKMQFKGLAECEKLAY